MLLKKYQEKIIEQTNKLLNDSESLKSFNGIYECPTLCYKVPTGGGKTLVGACVTESILKYFYKKNNGLIVWLTPSVEIYNQTLKHLRDYDSYIRQVLERASFGKVKIFEKNEYITKLDLEQGLCVLILTIQSLNRKDTEGLKFYDFNPSYLNYFYDENNVSEKDKQEFYNLYKGKLDFETITDFSKVSQSPTLSLSNIVKYANPLVIVDEAHKYGSSLSQETLSNINPSFIIELTATPLKDQQTFIEVGGAELEEEDMIKLPIYYDSINSEQKSVNWKILLQNANSKLIELSDITPQTKNKKLRYVRPIMLIRVDYVDEDLKKKGVDKINKIFPSDIVDYLINNLNVSREEISIKTSKTNELSTQENLLSKDCKIRYVITKDALKEGWDCPFAYVLANLTTSGQKSLTALTQLIGRVLRQPYTEKFMDSRLNSCYVYYDEIQLKNGKTIDGKNEQERSIYDIVVENLKKEGFDNFSEYVLPIDKLNNSSKGNNKIKQKNVKRREGYNYIVKLPKVLNSDGKEICFYRDILSLIKYDDFLINPNEYKQVGNKIYYDREILKTENQKNISNARGITSKLDELSIIKIFTEIIENSFVAKDVFDRLKKDLSILNIDIYDFNIISKILEDLNNYIYKESQNLFINIINKGFSISENNFWELPLTYDINEDVVYPIKDKDSSKSIFDYCVKMNTGESKELKNQSLANNNGFWKIPEKQKFSYYIKGWNKDFKVYPDFLIVFNGKKAEIKLLETKGKHLIGNKDTKYKEELFEALNNSSPKAILENNGKTIELPIIFELKEI